MRITNVIIKMDLLDILSTSLHYFCRKLIGATNENSNFDIRVSTEGLSDLRVHPFISPPKHDPFHTKKYKPRAPKRPFTLYVERSDFRMPFLPYLIMHSVHWDGRLLSPLVAWIADFCQSSSQDNFNDRQHNDDAEYSKCPIFLFSVLQLDIFLYKVLAGVVGVGNLVWQKQFDTPCLIPEYCNSGVDNTCHANRPNSMDLNKIKFKS